MGSNEVDGHETLSLIHMSGVSHVKVVVFCIALPFLFEENQRLGQSKWKLDKVLKGIEV